MGMFDYIRCNYPLPLAGANELEFQTKNTPAQFLERYEIRPYGSLWHEDYDVEYQSDPGAATGSFESLFGCAVRVRRRWERCDMTGEVCFYTSMADKNWVEFSAYFVAGQLKHLALKE